MKLDDDVKMISAEVPILFAKAAELFIQELTIHSWLQTEESRRRTLQVDSFFGFILSREKIYFSETTSQRQSLKTNCSTFSSILFHVKKRRKLIKRKKQSVKFNILLHCQRRPVSAIRFNFPVSVDIVSTKDKSRFSIRSLEFFRRTNYSVASKFGFEHRHNGCKK